MTDAAQDAEQHWYNLPGTSFKIPMPPSELYTALCMVLLFLPLTVIVTRLFGWRQPPVNRPKRD